MGKPGDVYVAGQNPGWLYRFIRPTRLRGRLQRLVEEIRSILPVKEGLALALNTERAPTSQALGLTLRMTGRRRAAWSGRSRRESRRSRRTRRRPARGRGAMSEPPGGALAEAFGSNPAAQFGMARSEVIVLDRAGFRQPSLDRRRAADP